MSLASAVTRTPSCSQHVSWSLSQSTDRCGEKARPNVCPPPFIVISVHRHACQLIKLCSENSTFYRRQSVVFRQWHTVRSAGRIAADPIMAPTSSHDSNTANNYQFVLSLSSWRRLWSTLRNAADCGVLYTCTETNNTLR